MKIDVQTAPVRPPVEKVVIELNAEEAALLRYLVGQTGGPYSDGKNLVVYTRSQAYAEELRTKLLTPIYEVLKNYNV